jgi:transposase
LPSAVPRRRRSRPEFLDLQGCPATGRPHCGLRPVLTPREGNADRLDEWITTARGADLPHLQAFSRGLDQDRDAVRAAVTLPFHNGGTEGVNTKTKRIMRQMHGRAGFALLRHRILLG